MRVSVQTEQDGMNFMPPTVVKQFILPNSMDLLCLLVAQVPRFRSRVLMIFVLTVMTQASLFMHAE